MDIQITYFCQSNYTLLIWSRLIIFSFQRLKLLLTMLELREEFSVNITGVFTDGFNIGCKPPISSAHIFAAFQQLLMEATLFDR